MKYLCDTHVLLWWLNDDKRLKASTKKILADPENLVYISVASAWEISLKLKTNPKFQLKKVSLDECFYKCGFKILEITLAHVLRLHTLAMYHHDPFDRILIAQAQVEKARLITNDEKICKYEVATVKI